MKRLLLTTSILFLALFTTSAQVRIVGHRGVRHNIDNPDTRNFENTISALDYCQGLGIYAAEFDIQLTKDGRIIVFHGPKMPNNATALPEGVAPDVHEMTFRQARRVVLPNGEHMPTLREWLAQGRRHPETRLICEIKKQSTPERETRAVELVLAAVRKARMQDQMEYTTFSPWMVQEIHRIDPSAKVLFLDSGKNPKTPQEAKEFGSDAISYDVKAFREHPEYVAQAHALGMEVTLWIVNDRENFDWGRSLGVDFISSDHPETLKQFNR